MFNFEGDLRLTAQGVHFGNPQHIQLLKEIDKTGSITQAAKAVPMSYKAAWDAVNKMNNLSSEPLVVRISGGKGGGGTCLTERGLQLVKHFEVISEAHAAFLNSMSQYSRNFQSDIGFLQQMRFQTSARNQLSGKVVKIESLGIHDDVYFDIGAEQLLIASITDESAKLLAIENNSRCVLLVKAPNVEIVTEITDNCLKASVISAKKDEDGYEIVLQVGNQTIVSTMAETYENALQENDDCYIRIDPKNIILVKA